MNAVTLAPLSVSVLNREHRFDWSFVIATLALVSVGLVMVASASVGFAASVYGDPWFFIKRHVIYLLLGGASAILVASLPVNLWRQYGWMALLLALTLLMLVLIPGIGRKVNGSQRWLLLGPLTLQASEVVKFCCVVFFASYLARRQYELQSSWKGIVKPLLVLGLIVFLLLLEPDFGSSVVLSATVVSMLFLAGVKLWQFAVLVLIGVSGLVSLALVSPYRLQRLITFLDPWADQFNSGYQLTQSLIAFGRGEWFGVGLGNSVQKLFYLPEAHTDFIFAIVAEELGLFGGAVVIGLFTFLVAKTFGIARLAIQREDYFSSFAAFGIGILLAGQAFINIGVASGLLPTKGLTLPFISYGGSSLIVSCALMAFLFRLDWELRTLPVVKPARTPTAAKSARRNSRSAKNSHTSYSGESVKTGRQVTRGRRRD